MASNVTRTGTSPIRERSRSPVGDAATIPGTSSGHPGVTVTRAEDASAASPAATTRVRAASRPRGTRQRRQLVTSQTTDQTVIRIGSDEDDVGGEVGGGGREPVSATALAAPQTEAATPATTAPTPVMDLGGLAIVLRQLQETLSTVITMATPSGGSTVNPLVPSGTATGAREPRTVTTTARGDDEHPPGDGVSIRNAGSVMSAVPEVEDRGRAAGRGGPVERAGSTLIDEERGQGRRPKARKAKRVRELRRARRLRRGQPDSDPSDSSESDESERSTGSDDDDDDDDDGDDESDVSDVSDASDEGDESSLTSEDDDIRRRRARRSRRYETRGKRKRERKRDRERERGREGQSREHRPTPGELDRRMKDLEIGAYIPSPKMAVSTWIDMVDMRLQGAERSRRGGWSDEDLYFILGNKLKESAAEWHVDLHRQLARRGQSHKMTWTHLKRQLLLRFGERLNRAQAEDRVRTRFKSTAEGYMTYASQLRRLVGRNRVREQVLLDQFYKQLSPGVLESVKRKQPLPSTVEGAARRAARYDPNEAKRVAVAMRRLGQRWAEAPPTYRNDRGDGQVPVIPGVGSYQTEAIQQRVEELAGDNERVEGEELPVITNQGGVFNPVTALWEVPPNFEYTGGAWAPKKRARKDGVASSEIPKRRRDDGRQLKRARVSTAVGKSARQAESSGDGGAGSSESGGESDGRSTEKTRPTATGRSRTHRAGRASGRNQSVKQVALIQQAVAAALRERDKTPGEVKRSTVKCFTCGEEGHLSGSCPRGSSERRCFACQRLGHYARDCPDSERKARNDEYLRTRARREVAGEQPAGNGERA
jgi:hypothetical protein